MSIYHRLFFVLLILPNFKTNILFSLFLSLYKIFQKFPLDLSFALVVDYILIKAKEGLLSTILQPFAYSDTVQRYSIFIRILIVKKES